MIKAHKIRLNPTPEQGHYFARAAGTARFTYNWALAQWQRQAEAGGTPSALALRTQFNAIKKDQFPWVYDVTKCAARGAFRDVAAAFRNFLSGARQVAKPVFHVL
jgi:putative transposase